MEVAQDYKFRQLILLEEFKSCLPPHIKTYLDERKVENLNQAAVLVDDYSLTHKGTFSKSDTESSEGRTNPVGRPPSVPGQAYKQVARFRYGNSERHHTAGTRATRSNIPVC